MVAFDIVLEHQLGPRKSRVTGPNAISPGSMGSAFC
jgi:hypothetical protein